MRINAILLLVSSVLMTGFSSAQTLYVPGGTGGIVNNTVNENVGVGEANPLFKLHMSANTQLAVNHTFVDNCIDADNEYIRSNFGSNVYWNAVSNRWKVKAIGSNDFSAIVHVNSDGWAFIAAPSDGNVNRSLTNYQFMRYERLRIRSNGDVGIGTSAPLSRLHIAEGAGGEQLRISRGTGAVRFAQEHNKDNLYLYNSDASQTYMVWKENGNVGIGTPNPDAKLAVKGTIHTQEVRVNMNNWSDYVFEDDYDLPSLSEVERYIKKYKHLPEVPSASEVMENGIQLGEMNAILLKKIEELTLHMIAQEKELQKLRDENETIRHDYEEIKSMIQK